ncbi:MAG: hypothetical protein QXJ74_00615 [Nitrososphaera sp.]|nr:hypothetical protein [Nitrososphaera sp.]
MLRFTRVAEAGFSGDFKQKVLNVYSLFPELQDDEITCGFIRKGSRLLGTARGWSGQIALQPNVGRMTIAHELTHLLQGNGVPHGEKACDIWALARLPRDMLDERPYYLLRHWHLERWLRNRAQAKSLCEQAIEVRRTNRTYIKWLSAQLRQLR